MSYQPQTHQTHFIYGLSWWRCFLLLFFYQQYKAEKSDNVNEYNPRLSCSTCHAERAVFSLRTVFGIPSVSGFQLPDPLPWARHDCGQTGLAEHSAMYITQLWLLQALQTHKNNDHFMTCISRWGCGGVCVWVVGVRVEESLLNNSCLVWRKMSPYKFVWNSSNTFQMKCRQAGFSSFAYSFAKSEVVLTSLNIRVYIQFLSLSNITA